MFGYIRRARALVATVRRLESELGDLQRTVSDIEERCQLTLERTRLENLALSKSMETESKKVGQAVTAVFEQMRLAKAQSSLASEVGRRNNSGAP